MRLFEAIVDANHRALSGDAAAGLRPDEFTDALPIVALTCIDPRLNPLLPEVLGVREEHFIWLRNAGNIIFDPMSSMMRTLALACAIKGGKEIAIVGHTDCLVCKATILQLMDRFRALGVDRSRLPENLNEFFGLSASERQNVIRGADIVRSSPLIGPKIPVHGLLLEITTGKLEWLVNGYQTLSVASAERPAPVERGGSSSIPLPDLPSLSFGELKFPQFKIGEAIAEVQPVSISREIGSVQPPAVPASTPAPARVLQPKPAEPAAQRTLRLGAADKFRIVGNDRKIYGPVLGAKLMDWIGDGRIDWQSLAKIEGGGEWKPLSVWATSAEAAPHATPPKLKDTLRSTH